MTLYAMKNAINDNERLKRRLYRALLKMCKLNKFIRLIHASIHIFI